MRSGKYLKPRTVGSHLGKNFSHAANRGRRQRRGAVRTLEMFSSREPAVRTSARISLTPRTAAVDSVSHPGNCFTRRTGWVRTFGRISHERTAPRKFLTRRTGRVRTLGRIYQAANRTDSRNCSCSEPAGFALSEEFSPQFFSFFLVSFKKRKTLARHGGR